MILAIRTDKPESEIYLLEDDVKDSIIWMAHRQLADTIHIKIKEIMDRNNLELSNLSGIIAYTGPGSFTGLRIGITVANTLAYSLKIPIVGINTDSWLQNGLKAFKNGQNDKIVQPFYGGEANITKPKK